MKQRKKSPVHTDDQESPEPERLVTPAEEAEMDVAEMEDPPQAEGPRDSADKDKLSDDREGSR